MIEIKEVVVRANINAMPSNVSKETSNSQKYTGNGHTDDQEKGNDNIVEACVKQVLAILERQKER